MEENKTTTENINTKIDNFRNEIVDLINKYNLPASVVEVIFELYLLEVRNLKTKEGN